LCRNCFDDGGQPPIVNCAIVDSGSKALASDVSGIEGYGIVRDPNDAPLYKLNEKHGYLDLSRTSLKSKVGDTLHVTMNHVCPVNNLFDKVIFVRGEKVLGALIVDARGKGQ
jgi:D-serine deaminase-like pyridoxal phosphate-dependent protein